MIPALVAVLSSTSLFANWATPFGVASETAPFIVVARCEKHDESGDLLKVLEVVKGDAELGTFPLKRPEWLYRPLETGGVYIIQLDRERRPWVEVVTSDPHPERQVPAKGCGTGNVMRVVDGYMHDFYQFITKGDGARVPLDEAKQPAPPGLGLANYTMNPTAGGASLLPRGNCGGGAIVDEVGPPAAGYGGR
ncbi:MAG: hypothetical protein ACREAA_05755 [Candidatus Polarisedimenticolia bacterium]